MQIHTIHRHQRGTTLLEALVSMLVLALGMLSIGQVQTQLRLNSELARQRSEAVRLAQEDLERLRAFSVLAATAGAHSFANIVSASTELTAADAPGGATRYQLVRSISAGVPAQAKNTSVAVRWADRSGAPHEVVLNSVIGGNDPALAGALSVAGARTAVSRQVHARSPAVPLAARNLGNGSSVFKPVGAGSVALLLDNADGAVLGHCTGVDPTRSTADLGSADLANCVAISGLLLSGQVRFSAAAPPNPGAANDPPLALEVALTMGDGSYLRAPLCSGEAMKLVSFQRAGRTVVQAVPIDASPASLSLSQWTETGDRHLAYHCVVYPATGSARWSGRVDLLPAGWQLGSAAEQWRVCRYSADLDGSGAVDANVEHPASYSGVDTALAHQNFLVVRGNEACPAGQPLRFDGAAGNVYVNLATVAHQP